MAFLDHAPIREGHTLIVPRMHSAHLFDLDEILYSGLLSFARMIALSLQRATHSIKIGVAVKGFQIPHAHVHLVPLYGPGGLIFDGRSINTHEDIEKIGCKLRPHFVKEIP